MYCSKSRIFTIDQELNLKEIGLVLGVSESRISQIHSQAAARLRQKLGGWGRA